MYSFNELDIFPNRIISRLFDLKNDYDNDYFDMVEIVHISLEVDEESYRHVHRSSVLRGMEPQEGNWHILEPLYPEWLSFIENRLGNFSNGRTSDRDVVSWLVKKQYIDESTGVILKKNALLAEAISVGIETVESELDDRFGRQIKVIITKDPECVDFDVRLRVEYDLIDFDSLMDIWDKISSIVDITLQNWAKQKDSYQYIAESILPNISVTIAPPGGTI